MFVMIPALLCGWIFKFSGWTQTPQMSRSVQVFWILVSAIAFAAEGAVLYSHFQALASAPQQQASPPSIPISPSRENARSIIDVSPQTLMDFYKDRSGLEADRMIAPYIGKWTKVTGDIADIQQVKGSGIQVLFTVSPFSAAFLIFDSEWLDQLSILQPHQNITALCQIDSAGASGANFVHCELPAEAAH